MVTEVENFQAFNSYIANMYGSWVVEFRFVGLNGYTNFDFDDNKLQV